MFVLLNPEEDQPEASKETRHFGGGGDNQSNGQAIDDAASSDLNSIFNMNYQDERIEPFKLYDH